MSLRTRTVATVRRRLPELDDEAAWRATPAQCPYSMISAIGSASTNVAP